MHKADTNGRAIPPELALDAADTAAHLVDFLRRETRRSGFTHLILGLSGGIDSAVSAALAARAVGPRRVLAVLLPYRTSSPASLTDARRVARRLGIGTEKVDITPMVDAYFRRERGATRRRRGNRMARERMAVLYDLSDRDRRLVVGTSNKTELLLGYGTIFGDLASALNPLGDLYKTQVRQLAGHLGIPDDLVWKVPTADLWAGQSDEGELGYSYVDIDRLLVRLVELRESPEEIVAGGFSRRMVASIARRVAGSQFKRRPPVLAKLTRRAVNIDFRYPRDWGS
ncbi:MAG TPA: NAD+ synthase [Dongiaceae bacterium]|nr:NAD+ synthase [Dongiaceae bacterium]